MNFRTHLRLMADWNAWCFHRLYAVVDRVREEDYRRDYGLFFKSVHATLNHMLLVEKMWLGRLTGELLAITGLDQELEPDRVRLKHRQMESAHAIGAYVKATPDEVLFAEFDYRATNGDPYTLLRAAAVHTLFTHGAHHRGQVTTVLTQLGLEAPVLDYPRFLASLPKSDLYA